MRRLALSSPFHFSTHVSPRALPDKGSKDQTLKPMDTSKAWLAPLFGDEAVPASKFKGNPDEAVWLAERSHRESMDGYVKTGATSDTTRRPRRST